MNYQNGEDELGHGNQTASIAAGKTLGVACDAEVVTIKIPMRRYGSSARFELIDLAAAFETLLSEYSQGVGGVRAVTKIDTLLLPNGMLRSVQGAPCPFTTVILGRVPVIYQSHDVMIVAAIGNLPAQTTFPADQEQVFSVGALKADGTRWEKSGFGPDGTNSRALPRIHILGCDVPCEDLDGRIVVRNGTSMAAATVAGIFTAMAESNPNSRSRWTKMQNYITVNKDEFGDLPVFIIK